MGFELTTLWSEATVITIMLHRHEGDSGMLEITLK